MTDRTKMFILIGGLVAAGVFFRMADFPDPIADRTPPTTMKPTTTIPPLESQIDLDLQACQSSGAVGWVTNGSPVAVDVFVEVQFLDGNGDIISDSSDWVRGLRPGEKGRWEASWFGSGIYRQCRAEIGGVFAR